MPLDFLGGTVTAAVAVGFALLANGVATTAVGAFASAFPDATGRGLGRTAGFCVFVKFAKVGIKHRITTRFGCTRSESYVCEKETRTFAAAGGGFAASSSELDSLSDSAATLGDTTSSSEFEDSASCVGSACDTGVGEGRTTVLVAAVLTAEGATGLVSFKARHDSVKATDMLVNICDSNMKPWF